MARPDRSIDLLDENRMRVGRFLDRHSEMLGAIGSSFGPLDAWVPDVGDGTATTSTLDRMV